MIQSFPKGFIKTQKTKTYTEYKVKGTGSVTLFIEPPTHPPEDRTGDYTQGLSLQLRLPGWDRPDSPQRPGPFTSWGLYQARGRPLSAGPDASLRAGVCSLDLPRTDAQAGGWAPPLNPRHRGAMGGSGSQLSIRGSGHTHTQRALSGLSHLKKYFV